MLVFLGVSITLLCLLFNPILAILFSSLSVEVIKMHTIDLTGIMLIIFSIVFFILAIRSKKAYIVAFSIGYSFLALPLIFLTGA